MAARRPSHRSSSSSALPPRRSNTSSTAVSKNRAIAIARGRDGQIPAGLDRVDRLARHAERARELTLGQRRRRRAARALGSSRCQVCLSSRRDVKSACHRVAATRDILAAVKLATIRDGDRTRAVRVDGDTAVDIGVADVGELLRNEGWRQRAESASGATRPVAGLDFAPLIPRPEKIICVGLNYRNHILETGREIPEYPTLFAKFIAGAHRCERRRRAAPSVSDVGRLGGRARGDHRQAGASRDGRERAPDAIAGYACSTTCRCATTRTARSSGCRARRSSRPRRSVPTSSRRTRRRAEPRDLVRGRR